MSEPKKVVIAGGARIPFSRSGSKYAELGNLELMNGAMSALIEKYGLQGRKIDEVICGSVVKRNKDFALARESVLKSELDNATPGLDITRACGTSLEAALIVANKIALGQIEVGIAGGSDTSSDVPIELSKGLSQGLVKLSKARTLPDKVKTLADLKLKDISITLPGVKEPSTGLTMGEHCELMAKEWKIERSDQDELAFKSHNNATRAYEDGFYSDLVYSFGGLDKDDNVRPDSTVEALAKLKPAFDKENGTLTAGNSSPLTDGASVTLLCSEDYANKHNLEIQCYLTFGQVSAVDFTAGEGLLMAPVKAISEMLTKSTYSLDSFDFYEIHEAFAAQVLCTLKALNDVEYCQKIGAKSPWGEIDMAKLNVKGSSISIGHPFAATGSRILAQASKLLKEKGSGKCLLSICTAGGMGVTAILEK